MATPKIRPTPQTRRAASRVGLHVGEGVVDEGPNHVGRGPRQRGRRGRPARDDESRRPLPQAPSTEVSAEGAVHTLTFRDRIGALKGGVPIADYSRRAPRSTPGP